MARLFGTDGVRGIANKDLSPELAFQLGYAGAKVLAGHLQHRPQVVVGTDTRLSSSMLSHALSAGLCAAGADVHFCGVLPTPGIAFLTRDKGFDAGVVLSASHNPFEFNGIKFFNSEGFKLSDALEDEIEALLKNEEAMQAQRPIGADIGVVHAYPQGAEHYLNHLRYAMGLDLTGIKLAVDCAQGAAADLAPKLFRQLGAEVFALGHTPDGCNINEQCGSTCMDALQELVVSEGCDLGLAFDGDADRLLAVDEKGQTVDGDALLSILARYLRAKARLPKDTFVVTVMSNLGLHHFAEHEGFQLKQTKVGDRYVLEEMKKGGYTLGGEQSGHMILLDYGTTGDGLLSALALLKALRHLKQTLSEAVQVLPHFPQVLQKAQVPSEHKERIMNSPRLREAISNLEIRLGNQGRVLVRPSGTEPVVRVMLEGRDREEIQQAAQTLVQVIEEELRE